MADPLTSSDIINLRMGFGPSTPEERERAAGAGVLPLSAMEREKFERGGGLSPTASKAEKEAWTAAEVMAGRRSPMDLPRSFGGLGERPEATTRRGLRMQQEWDKQYEMMVEQQKFAQQLDLQRRAEARLQRDQDLEFLEKQTLEEREERIQNEAGLMINAMRGAIAPDGTVIANPIRPEDEDAIDRLNNLARDFSYGIENKAAASMYNMLLNDASKFREKRMEQSKQQESIASALSARTGKPMAEYGEYTEDGIFKPNLNTIVKEQEAIKEAEAQKAEERTIATEKRRAETAAGVAEERNIAQEEKTLNREIRRANEELRKLRASFGDRRPEQLSATQRSNLQAAKDTILERQIDKAALRGLVFDDQEEFTKAREEGKIPSGSRVFIGRVAVDIP